MKYLILCLVFSTNLFAKVKNAPPSFKVNHQKVVFIDIKKAQYEIVFDARSGTAEVQTIFNFHMPEQGFPLFDSYSETREIKLNGQKTSQQMIRVPGNVSTMRMVQTRIPTGHHTLTMRSSILKGISFTAKENFWSNFSAGFFIRDLKDRMFLEQYLPTNYEYDQYKINMDVRVIGTKRWHSLFANGKITKLAENHFRVSMPNWYSASSVFFHLVPINKFVRWYLKYPSIDGRQLPVTIYSSYRFYNHYVKQKAWKVLAELEKDYGPFPHEKLIIYGTGIKGGMEHAGAVETSIISLGHELQHMYFAKGIHPANGNSGWLDEAIASWRDKGHQSHELPFYESANLGRHNQYTRKTDKRSYEYGRSFMAYIDYTLKEAGRVGLKDFLRKYFDKRKHTTVTTEDFKSDLEEYAQMSFQEDFFQYIYGGHSQDKSIHSDTEVNENPHHPILTDEEFRSIL
jgi:hypothetical protein